MTEQELFDTVAKHLLTQGKQSLLPVPIRVKSPWTDTITCAYRGTGGLTCAWGCLILPEEYTEEMEGVNIDEEVFVSMRRRLGLTDQGMKIAEDLQEVHDRYEPYEWYDKLIGVAATYNLSSEVLNAFAPTN